MSTWSLRDNPHLHRLNKSPLPIRLQLPTVYGIFAGIIVGAIANFVFNIIAVNMVDAYFLTAFGLLVMTLYAGIFAAWVTVSDCATQNYEILCLTYLPDNLLVWGYLRSTWQKLRLLIGLQLGFGAVFGILFWGSVVVNDAFTPLIAPLNADGSTTLPSQENISDDLFIGLLYVTVGYWGVFLASTTLGVLSALSIRNLYLALGTTLLSVIVIAGIWGTGIYADLLPYVHLDERAQLPSDMMIYTLAPYVIWFALVQLAYSTARRPLLD